MADTKSDDLPRRAVAVFSTIVVLDVALVGVAMSLAWDAIEYAAIVSAAFVAAISVLTAMALVVASRMPWGMSKIVSVGAVVVGILVLVVLQTTFGDQLGLADWIGAGGFLFASLASVALDRSLPQA